MNRYDKDSTLGEAIDALPPLAAPMQLSLVLLYHPEIRRIGQLAEVPFETGDRVTLNRLQPLFRAPRAKEAERSIDDPFVSRSKRLIIEAGAYHKIHIRPSTATLVWSLDGEPQTGAATLPAGQLDRGVRIGLGKRVIVGLQRTRAAPHSPHDHGLVGASCASEALRQAIDRAAPQRQTVLIRGETGSGKELVARALFEAGKHSGSEPFVVVNMAAVGASTAVSQLFGHDKGAFTGAQSASSGFFGQAHGGTLFLDELGEVPIELQALLLRALESGEIQPIGGPIRHVDVRLILATDADLEGLVGAGTFRPALLHRISGCTLQLKPLRERPADIAEQLIVFLDDALGRLDKRALLDGVEPRQPPWLRVDLVETLLRHRWPGNSRELRGVAEQIASLSHDLPHAKLPPSFHEQPTAPAADGPQQDHAPAPAQRGEPDGEQIRRVLREQGYRINRSAKVLGLAKNTLYARMAELGLPRAGELTAEQIERARRAVSNGNDWQAVATRLEVSVAGLRRRVKTLGLKMDA